MADDDKRPDLTNSTVTEFFIKMRRYNLEGRFGAGNNDANIGVNLSPTSGVFGPALSASAGVGPEGRKSGSFTAAVPVAVPGLGPAETVLAFSKSVKETGSGLDVKSNVSTDLGSGKAFFEENRAANGPRTTAFGGSFRPIEGLNLSAQRQEIDEGPTKDRFGFDYENSGIFKAFAELNDKKPSMLGGSYTAEDPFGFGGRFEAQGSVNKNSDQPLGWNVGARYTRSF